MFQKSCTQLIFYKFERDCEEAPDSGVLRGTHRQSTAGVGEGDGQRYCQGATLTPAFDYGTPGLEYVSGKQNRSMYLPLKICQRFQQVVCGTAFMMCTKMKFSFVDTSNGCLYVMQKITRTNNTSPLLWLGKCGIDKGACKKANAASPRGRVNDKVCFFFSCKSWCMMEKVASTWASTSGPSQFWSPGRSWSLLVAPGRSWSLCYFGIRSSSSHKLHVEACTYAFHNDVA